MENIKSFYDLEQLVKQSVKNHIIDNREHINEARKEYLEDHGKIDGFFYQDDMRDGSRDIADNYVIYYYDAWQICNVSRFDAPSGCDYFWQAESEIQDCHDGSEYIDKYMTSIAYLIVESLAMEFFSEFLLVEKLPFDVPTEKLVEAIEAL